MQQFMTANHHTDSAPVQLRVSPKPVHQIRWPPSAQLDILNHESRPLSRESNGGWVSR